MPNVHHVEFLPSLGLLKVPAIPVHMQEMAVWKLADWW